MVGPAAQLVAELRAAGVERGTFVALALAPRVGLAVAVREGTESWLVPAARPGAAEEGAGELAEVVRALEDAFVPRWVLWSQATAAVLAREGVRLATAWDLAAVHRLHAGGWRDDPARIWALQFGLSTDELPAVAAADLFGVSARATGDLEEPVRPDGYLQPEWVTGGWAASAARLRRWAEIASVAAARQHARLASFDHRPKAPSTARSESTAELLCAEMSVRGLPMDRAAAEAIVASSVGPRPRDEAEAAAQRAARDAEVLRHAPSGPEVDLRSPGQVKALLRRAGLDLPDTRAWRLQELVDAHPLVGPLLTWRKAERVSTTYGYAWLDEHLGSDGRLRGSWSGSDGAAGRMTASGGLHNMPAEMRGAVIAESGCCFVRADLGQIEPRVLAAVSGDRAFARASQADDIYAPVALELGVERAVAKVAVLGAMYGQTTGHGAQAMRGLASAYPVAVAYLENAARAAAAGHDLWTYGGRRVVMGASGDAAAERESRSIAAARGRYGRNALVQGAAAELFKAWAVTVRARGGNLRAEIVLCLHDELLVQVPEENGPAAAKLLEQCLDEAVRRWAPDDSVRFLADVAVVSCWADAKA